MYYRRKKILPQISVFADIFNNVYSMLECNIIYVFLCGGACEKGSGQIRNDIKSLLEKYAKNIQILYPEILFLKKGDKGIRDSFKEKDLLELETILAHNSNVVCIICESMGSATELGAFTNYKNIDKNILLDKLVAVTYRKYKKNEPSFISEGPIKRIVNRDKNKYKIYELDDCTGSIEIPKIQEKLALELIEEFQKICIYNNSKDSRNCIFLQKGSELNSFIGLSYLILLLIYFYEKLTNPVLVKLLKTELAGLKILDFSLKKDNKKFDSYYEISKVFLCEHMELLHKADDDYTLTPKGLEFLKNDVFKNIKNMEPNTLDRIRMKILHKQLFKKKGDYIS